MSNSKQKIFEFSLTGRITWKIARSWFIVIFCINTFLAIPDWGPEKNFSYVQIFIFTQIGFLSSLSSILLSLFLFNPSNIVIRALICSIAGNAGAIISTTLAGPLLFGDNFIYQLIFQGIAFGNILGLFIYGIPLYWQWHTDMEKNSPEKLLKPHPKRKNFPIDLDITGTITPKIIVSWFFASIGFTINNSLLGWFLIPDIPYYFCIIFAGCIGFSMFFFILVPLITLNLNNIFLRVLTIFIFGNIGIITGLFLSYFASGVHIGFESFTGLHFFYNLSSFAIISSIFYWRFRIDSRENLTQERVKRLKLERKAEKNKLVALQAQLEPQFLFQTLTHIIDLLTSDPEKAKQMQLNLIQYLRASLSKIRVGAATIAQQMEMLRAYFEIQVSHMEKSLCLNIDIPKHLDDYYFPPMLIQPLFENAVMQRVQSKKEGGVISIRAEEDRDFLRLIFRDSNPKEGKRFNLDFLFNSIRNRLQKLFEEQGVLIINDQSQANLEAVIQIPKSIHKRMEIQ